MECPDDPRAKRSRQALIDALMRILDGTMHANVNISEIVRDAKVSRPTLYQHFGDIPGLARAAFLERSQAVFDKAERMGTDTWEGFTQAHIYQLLKQIDEYRNFYSNMFAGVGGYTVTKDAIAFLADQILTHSRLGVLIESKATVLTAQEEAHSLAAGVFWIVEQWVQRFTSNPESVEVMANKVSHLLLTHSGLREDDINMITPVWVGK